MNALTLQMESLLRLGMFLAFFSVFAILEIRFPRRKLRFPKYRRWVSNISISVLNTVLTRIVIPAAGAGTAIMATELNLGLLNRLNMAGWIELIAFLLIFDLAIYFQHRLFHWIKPLWLLHRMHHTDPDYDLT
ncbi:MAG: sterol desaturase family protein, partial [Gammaproteobacteria bacterium]|nr:sterol desaturase family protein [Gammaproteobacteria bacterium]